MKRMYFTDCRDIKKGDFSVKPLLIELMNQTKDESVLNLCIRLFCSVCTNEDLRDVSNLRCFIRCVRICYFYICHWCCGHDVPWSSSLFALHFGTSGKIAIQTLNMRSKMHWMIILWSEIIDGGSNRRRGWRIMVVSKRTERTRYLLL